MTLTLQILALVVGLVLFYACGNKDASQASVKTSELGKLMTFAALLAILLVYFIPLKRLFD